MSQKVILIIINVVFGSMVLLSYYHGVGKMKSLGKDPSLLWGGVPDTIQPFIITFMFLGAIGYAFFTYNFLVNVNPDEVLFLNKFKYSTLHILYLLVFIPSALWIYQTMNYMSSGTQIDWIITVGLLFTVAISSIFILLFTIDLQIENKYMYLASVIGALLFTFHTLFLDGLIWTVFYHK